MEAKQKTTAISMTYECRWLVVAVSLILLGGEGAKSPRELVREANAAVAREQFEDALKLYTQAERRTTDPGLIAFNKAVILYRLERYREAEHHYERALAGADPKRLAKSYYGLGNAKLRRSEGTDISVIQNAIDCFRRCRAVPIIPEDLRRKTNKNLEIARVLLTKARADLAKKKQPKEGGNEKTQTNDGNPDKTNDQKSDGSDPGGKAQPVKTKKKAGTDGEGEKQDDVPPVPGKGNLPPLPDDKELQPIDPEDTNRYLERMLQRIERRRQQQDQAPAKTSQGFKDW